MFSSYLNYDVEVFLDGYSLTGVNNTSMVSNQASNVLAPIGTTEGTTFVAGPPIQTMSVSRALLQRDPLENYLDNPDPIQGGIFYKKDDSFYSFESGYIKNYSVNCAVGSVPKVNLSLDILDEVQAKDFQGTNIRPSTTIEAPKQGSVFITSDDFQTNRVVGFNYSASINQKILYTIGSNSPQSLKQIKPISYTATVEMELDQPFNGKSFDFSRSREDRNISLEIKGRRGAEIKLFSIPNASLVGSNVSQSSEGLMKLTLTYIGRDSKTLPGIP